MKLRLIALLLVFGASVSAQVFRGNADVVVLNVTVSDAEARFIPGLDRGDFRILEDGHLSEPLDESEFYSGCWGAATVSLYPYAHVSGSKGIGVSLGYGVSV